jgi:hypothetical protein
MVGPHDLTAEMGILGQFGDATFRDALRTVAKACRDHDTIFGIAGIRDLELLSELVELGLRFVRRRARTPPASARSRSGARWKARRTNEHRDPHRAGRRRDGLGRLRLLER